MTELERIKGVVRARGEPGFGEFYEMSPERRDELLLREIRERHRWHFERNRAYRRTLELRGLGPEIDQRDLPGLLRGDVYPPFFQSADRVRLINGNRHHDPSLVCPCGEDSPYVSARSIQRVDLLEKAGCGATL